MKKFQVREKSGNFTFSQGNLEIMKKVREKSGNFKLFKNVESQHVSENYIFYKLQAVYIQKQSFSNIFGLRFFFKD